MSKPNSIRPIIRTTEKHLRYQTPFASKQIEMISKVQAEAAKVGDERTIDIMAIIKRRIIRRQVTK